MQNNIIAAVELAREANKSIPADTRKLNLTATLSGIAKEALDHGEEVTAELLVSLTLAAAAHPEGPQAWLGRIAQLRKRNHSIHGLVRASLQDTLGLDAELKLRQAELVRRQGLTSPKQDTGDRVLTPMQLRQQQTHALLKATTLPAFTGARAVGALFSLVYTALNQGENLTPSTISATAQTLGLDKLLTLGELRGKTGSRQRAVLCASHDNIPALEAEIATRQALVPAKSLQIDGCPAPTA